VTSIGSWSGDNSGDHVLKGGKASDHLTLAEPWTLPRIIRSMKCHLVLRPQGESELETQRIASLFQAAGLKRSIEAGISREAY
jgi:hypothetical protein